MSATLLLAAHGTRSEQGSATIAAFAAAVQAARPDVPVELGFLDVASPALGDALDALAGRSVIVVPFLLSAGYHVTTDIPEVVAGRPDVRVARHLGPDPAVVEAVVDRWHEAGAGPGEVLLASIPSSRASARDEIHAAARLVSERIDRPVTVLPLGDADLPDGPFSIAAHLLAEGGFLDRLRAQVGDRVAVAQPIGVHPAVVALVWARYDEMNRPPS